MNVDWAKNQGLVPAIVQDADTNEVLMMGYMSEESLAPTLERRRVTFFSRSRKSLWVKGETSGNFLDLVDVKLDCDRDTLLVKARPHGPVCHLGSSSCFGDERSTSIGFLSELGRTIADRFENPDAANSYVSKLIARGEDRMIQKVGEEAIETVIAAKGADIDAFEGEAADLLFHLMVLLRAKGSTLDRVVEVLEKRRVKK